ncbi:uncharacterized protein AMSG_08749 [Thecamonas trahens ATCC 50062]|uniref:Uncharacterized protein n=1 Tax=Thecamonas trahens ATCC 50062 TaxID=461836 RepID=A0A0L0DML0_THETB|nr:hypothetical protein AMSG_08749 [Thecamonas trahens ATCC 50062]KNC53261.1 hypothetical protein AMSG_08749 [Thecamonas trahens ATCC 50062]|eukprot:XP_013754525.1 hypothetical protein AMSG_08749 [Thecamonas trahens ATCC 50062]
MAAPRSFYQGGGATVANAMLANTVAENNRIADAQAHAQQIQRAETETLWRSKLDVGLHGRTQRAQAAMREDEVSLARKELLILRRRELKERLARDAAEQEAALARNGLSIYHGVDGLE